MSECSLCDNYSDDLTPVDFRNAEDLPEELREYIGLGSYLDDTEATQAANEFWENCAHLCLACFRKYFRWITWWG